MHQRKAVENGRRRPSGTDGSDFSYRMVVDSRYQKVAQGKSRLAALIFAQGVIQFITAIALYLNKLKGVTVDPLLIYSTAISFVSLLLGEIGRKLSRINFLKAYIFGSSAAALTSVACLLKSDQYLEIVRGFSSLEASNFEFLNLGAVFLGVAVAIFAVAVTISLVSNMAPPKKPPS